MLMAYQGGSNGATKGLFFFFIMAFFTTTSRPHTSSHVCLGRVGAAFNAAAACQSGTRTRTQASVTVYAALVAATRNPGASAR